MSAVQAPLLPVPEPVIVEGPKSRPPSRRLATFVWALVLLALIANVMSIGVEATMHFLGSAIDGPFQLYNSLRRIAAGQHGGVDFQFFHGIGLPYLHYIPFRLLGGSFVASELSRQLLTIMVYPLVLLVFFRTFTRDWPRTLVLTTIVFALSIAFRLTSMVVAINSLLGVRSALPTLLAAVLCFRLPRRVRNVAVGVTLGGSLLLGTEQGLAVSLAFLIVNAVAIWRGKERRARVVDGAVALGVMALTVVIVMTAIGGVGGMKSALYYNLKLVPMDQYWYFGAPPAGFIRSWRHMLVLFSAGPRVPETIAIGIIVVVWQLRRLWREPDGDAGQRHLALSIMALYGLISCASILGIYVAAYMQPCIRILLLIGALELDRLIPPRDARLGRPPVLAVPRTLVMVLGAALVVMTMSVTSVITAFITTIPHIIADHIVRGEGMQWSGIWPTTLAEGQKVFDAHRGPNGAAPKIWSTYAGMLEARNGVFHPSFDYVIHALGPANRAGYVDQFKKERPTLVQTVMPTYSVFESWIEQTTWDFYAELLRNYQITGGTLWSIFWDRLPTPNDPPAPMWSTTLSRGTTSVEIPSPPRFVDRANVTLMQVEVDYRVHNPLHVLPLVGALPRYLVTVTNAINRYAITLDPYTTTTRFVVIGVNGTNPKLSFATYSLLPGASYEVSSVRVSKVAVSDANGRWLENLIEQQLQRQKFDSTVHINPLRKWLLPR